MCLDVVQRNGLCLIYIPEKFKTQELCEIAFSQNKQILHSIPEKFITQEMCESAILQNGWNLQYIPNKYITKELIEKAKNNLIINNNIEQYKKLFNQLKTENNLFLK